MSKYDKYASCRHYLIFQFHCLNKHYRDVLKKHDIDSSKFASITFVTDVFKFVSSTHPGGNGHDYVLTFGDVVIRYYSYDGHDLGVWDFPNIQMIPRKDLEKMFVDCHRALDRAEKDRDTFELTDTSFPILSSAHRPKE